jgi:hypothetical protein
VTQVTVGPGTGGPPVEPGTLEVTVFYTLVETQTTQAVAVTVA